MQEGAGQACHDGAVASPLLDGPAPTARGSEPAPAPASEPAIAAAIAQGDARQTIALLDAAYGCSLYRFIRAMVRSDDVADDVYQSTLIDAFRDLRSFGGRSSARTWLFAIARHRCLDALKLTRRRAARFTSVERLPEAADPAAAVDRRLSDAQLRTALERCLGELAPELRMVLAMRFTEGFSYDEIARICGARPEAVRARVCRAMPVLRRCIERRGAV